MKRLILVLLISSFLVGCPKPKPQIVYKTKYVDVPVYQIPKFDIPPEPVLPTDLLVEQNRTDYATIGKAYVATKITLEGYIKELLNLLQAIKKEE